MELCALDWLTLSAFLICIWVVLVSIFSGTGQSSEAFFCATTARLIDDSPEDGIKTMTRRIETQGDEQSDLIVRFS